MKSASDQRHPETSDTVALLLSPTTFPTELPKKVRDKPSSGESGWGRSLIVFHVLRVHVHTYFVEKLEVPISGVLRQVRCRLDDVCLAGRHRDV